MRGDTRGQSGLDRLMLFVLALVVVVLVVPFVLGLGGVDVREPRDNGSDPADQPTDLAILGASGQAEGGEVGVVRVVVTKNGSGETIDVRSVIGTWTGASAHTLTSTGSASNGSDAFGLSVDGSSGSKLASFGDRATLTFDLGDDDVDGVPEFGRALRPGDRVTLELTTAAGKTTSVVIVVPDQIPASGEVSLRLSR